MKEEMKYCKFCDEEKPIKEFVKSGFAIKNICRKCQSEKQKKIYSDSKKLRLLQSQLKAKEEMVKVMEKYFELIIDLGFDYDELSQVDGLKWLIDELVHYAKLGRACNITEAIYENENKKFNILHKEILSKGENK